jgi:hypothetical protein
MGYMKALKPLSLLSNALNGLRAIERRIVLYLDQWLMSKHSLV